MLKRSAVLASRVAIATLMVVAALAVPIGPPAVAQPGVDCPNGQLIVVDGEQVCFVRTTGPVTLDGTPVAFGPPSGGGGGVQTECTRPIGGTPGAGPETVRCYGPAGWYSYSWDCFFSARDVAPAEGMPGFELHGDEGLVFRALCWSVTTNPYGLQHWYPPLDAWGLGDDVVLAEPPDGYGGTPSMIVELWLEAVNALGMRGPEIGTAPPVDSAGLVHLPVWMWTEVTENTWREPGDPLHAQADARPQGINEWVDAYAQPQHIEWDMGDGLAPEQCGAGVAWGPDSDIYNPPAGACRHTYQRPSRDEPGGAFEIVAITTWLVWWEINGVHDNEVEIQVGTTTSYQVNEMQVLSSR